ncbi:ketoacyl-synthetase C-terminal extension domain-containing protein [Actinomadura luteofluorescens]|uniref:ketoacyl-synthetase C-terminal extension domain-containing protein n=1 Tax=Actinomadura luteofluorescens TaxID=46163 RepID=UPI0036427812
MRLVREAAEWARDGGGPRRAAVNAFGFGGANAHVVLEEPPAARRPRRRRLDAPHSDEGVLRLAARTTEELSKVLAAPDEELLAGIRDDVPDLPCRLAIVGPTARRLDLARALVQRGTAWRGRSDVWFSPRPSSRTAVGWRSCTPVSRPPSTRGWTTSPRTSACRRPR